MGGKNLAPRENGMVGLAYYLVEVENKEFWSICLRKLRETRLEPTGFLFLNSPLQIKMEL